MTNPKCPLCASPTGTVKNKIGTFIECSKCAYSRRLKPSEEAPFPSPQEKRDDPVNGPKHYGGEECLDAMKVMLSPEEYRGFLRGNSFKYRWRYRSKNGVQDLDKAAWYENKLRELENDQ